MILYGESYGPGIRTLHYGVKSRTFIAFDFKIDGKYVNYDKFVDMCSHIIPRVPELLQCEYCNNFDDFLELSSGNSVLAETNGTTHIREGIVVKPFNERIDTRGNRVIVKFISDEYLFSKNAKNDTTDI